MRDPELSAFQNEQSQKDKETANNPLPESVPDSLLDGFIPPIKERVAISPDHPTCDVKTGDLLVIHVGDEAMEYYGFLILAAYANKLIGINLHNHSYGSRELDSWVEWYEEYEKAGDFKDGAKRIYTDIAPIKSPEGQEATQPTSTEARETEIAR
jgi:hypothetical protein